MMKLMMILTEEARLQEEELSMKKNIFNFYFRQPQSFHDLQAVEVDNLVFKGEKKSKFFFQQLQYPKSYINF